MAHPKSNQIPRRRQSARFSLRAKLPDGKIKEIGQGTDLEELITQAKQYHEKTKADVWIWRPKDGATLFAIAGLVQKAGAR